MKKWLMLFLIVFLLTACQNDEHEAIKKEDEIKISYGGIQNSERFHKFSKRVADQKKDKIRIIQNTKEGDPIYQDVEFDGEVYRYTHDNREDANGSQEITKNTCKEFHVTETNTETTAILNKCEEYPMVELFTLEYNSLRKDRFDFALKYGENLESVIDTNKTPMENKEKNVVLKNLVYIDWIKDKDFSGSCSNPKMKYELTIWMNGGKDHFKWNDCNKGKDVEDMNGVVETIIGVFEHQ